MLDWQAFLKLDNAATIDFLSSYASALSAEGLISERAVDNLKFSLASVTPQLSSTNSSVITLLSENESEFIEILAARYGHTGFAWNHMRASTRNLLSETCAHLASWADSSLKKAELFMNRSFISTTSTGESRRELFPTVLFHTAKTLHDAAKDLREVIIELSVMRPADVLDTSGEQHDRELRVATLVGFNGLETEALSFCRTEHRSLKKIVSAFDELAFTIPQLVAGINENTAGHLNSKKLEAECEIFAAECQRLAGARFDVSSNLNVWETRRLGFLFELFSLNHRMSALAKLFVESFSPKEKTSASELLTDDVERAIACNLVRRGTAVKQASKAAKDLMSYCRHHRTTPATIIVAELKKINSDLHEDTLSFAAQISSEAITATPGGSGEKSRFFEAAKKIRKSLNVTAPFSVPLGALLLSFLMGSCGVKTQIVSEGVDPRPEIPFHQTAKIKNQKQEQQPANQNQDLK